MGEKEAKEVAAVLVKAEAGEIIWQDARRGEEIEGKSPKCERLQNVLAKILPKKVKLAQPTLYTGGWEQYIAEFCKIGGVIECAPPMC